MPICTKGTTICRHSNARLAEKIALLSHLSPKVEDLKKRFKKGQELLSLNSPSRKITSNELNQASISTEQDAESAFGMDNYKGKFMNDKKKSLNLEAQDDD